MKHDAVYFVMKSPTRRYKYLLHIKEHRLSLDLCHIPEVFNIHNQDPAALDSGK